MVTLQVNVYDVVTGGKLYEKSVKEKSVSSNDPSDRRLLKMSKSVKKLVEETKDQGYTELDLCDRGLSTIADIPGLSKCTGSC